MIHHFYHVYADGNWQEPVSEHIRALKESGLYDNLTSFHIGFVGKRSNQLAAHQYIQSLGMVYKIADEQETGWEQVTQIPMWEFSKHNDGLMLYAHTKGASNPAEVDVRWRRSMIYWNVIRWRDCIEKLKEVDTVGSHWIYPTLSMPEHVYGNPMYAGTFYWVKCELLRTWMCPPLNHRYESEGWIGYKYVQKPWRLWDWTPYFPNTDHFADGWVYNPAFVGIDTGKEIEPIVLHNKQVPNDTK